MFLLLDTSRSACPCFSRLIAWKKGTVAYPAVAGSHVDNCWTEVTLYLVVPVKYALQVFSQRPLGINGIKEKLITRAI